ncbi:MAG: phosphoribosylformylglycinamidine synthase subunit PurS [Bacteroidota bacterium]
MNAASGSPFLVRVHVMLRPSILDPQGKAVGAALSALGFSAVQGVRMGKEVELRVEARSEEEARRIGEEAARRLLANPVMEDFRVETERVP